MDKIRLGVIFGSRSCEREVAIISAVQLMNNVDESRYTVIPVYIHEDGVWYTGAPLRNIRTFLNFQPGNGIVPVTLDMHTGSGALLSFREGKGPFDHPHEVMVARMDVCIVVMHGLHGEDGTLQGMLELADLPYSSTAVAGSAIGMDKIIMKQFFRGADLPVLPGLWYTASVYGADPAAVHAEVAARLGYPVFVKPANLGSSIGVSRADNEPELEEALKLAFSYDRRVLVEKGLVDPLELNCSVLGYDDRVEASPIEMPVTVVGDKLLDFKDKYLRSGGSKGMASLSRVLPAPIGPELTAQIQEMSVEIFQMLDCKGVVRIDYMFDRASGGLYITEINTIPGSMAFYLWENAGMPYARLIDRLVEVALQAREDKRNRNYAFRSNILTGTSLGGAKGSKGAKGGWSK